MAYTYDDFEKAVNNANMMGQFSTYDLDLARQNPSVGMGLLSAKQQWNRATTDAERQAANAAAEALRSQHGSYTGGSWGLEYNPFGGTTDPMGAFDTSKYQVPSFDASAFGSAPTFDASAFGSAPTFDASAFGSAPTYTSQYADLINSGLANLQNRPEFSFDEVQPEYTDRYGELVNEMLNNVTGYTDFSYNKANDPVWQALAKQYRREGDRALENSLAQTAAANGGALSSNAIYAAQMAQNNYNAALNNIIPQLYSDAYNRHLSDFGIAVDKFDAARAAEQADYNKYLNDLNQFNTNRDFAWNQYTGEWNMDMDAYNAALAADQNAYNQFLSQLDQFNNDRNFGLNVYQTQLDQFNADRNFGLDSYQTQLDQFNNDRSFGYGTWRDQVADSQYQQEFDYMMQADAYDRMIDQQRYEDELALAQAKAAAAASRGGSGGSGGGGGNNNNNNNTTPTQTPQQTTYTPITTTQANWLEMASSGQMRKAEIADAQNEIIREYGTSFYYELLSLARP